MPAPSDLHEKIVSDVWQIFQTHVVERFGSVFDPGGIMFSYEPMISNRLMSINGAKMRKADFYFEPNDGHGPVLGEVGEMPSGKWRDVLSNDGLPIRILRVGFDRSIGIINPRFTKREVGILKIVQAELWRFEFGEKA